MEFMSDAALAEAGIEKYSKLWWEMEFGVTDEEWWLERMWVSGRLRTEQTWPRSEATEPSAKGRHEHPRASGDMCGEGQGELWVGGDGREKTYPAG